MVNARISSLNGRIAALLVLGIVLILIPLHKDHIWSFEDNNISTSDSAPRTNKKKEEDKEGRNYKPGQLLIRFKEDIDVDSVVQRLNIKAEGVSRTLNIKPVIKKYKKTLKFEKDLKGFYSFRGKSYKQVKEIPDEELFKSVYEKFSPQEKKLYRWHKIILKNKSTDLEELIETLKMHPDIEEVQTNNIYTYHTIPDDPYYHSSSSWGQDYNDLWGLKAINIENAWDISQGEGVVVAVIDSGVDYNHQELFDNIWVNPDEVYDRNLDEKVDLHDIDLNGDRYISDEEIEAASNIAGIDPTYADINADGIVNYEDIRIFTNCWLKGSIELANPDMNADMVVDCKDYSILARNWLRESDALELSPADFNGDGIVNYADLRFFTYSWLKVGDEIILGFVKQDINRDRFVDFKDYSILANNWCKEKDGNGYDDDLMGIYFFEDDDWLDYDEHVMDTDGHGTHVAGIIAAIGNNSRGIIGVAPQSKIMIIKSDLSSISLFEAILYAAEQGAKVLNNSWGPRYPIPRDSYLEDVVDYAVGIKNCVVVFSAGNENSNLALYAPNNYEKVIAVGSIDHNNIKTDFSNWGDGLDVVAPGGDSGSIYDTLPGERQFINILSLRANNTDMYCEPSHDPYNICGELIINNAYYRARGTSMSAPHVSGLAALIFSIYPNDIPNDIKWKIRLSATDLGEEGFDYNYGFGRIDCYQALIQEPTPAIVLVDYEVSEKTGDGDNVVEPGENASLVVMVTNEWKDANSVSLILSTQNPYIQINNPSACIGPMPADTPADNNSSPFTFFIDPNFPPYKEASFILSVEAGGYSRDLPFRAMIPSDIPHSSMIWEGREGMVSEVTFLSDFNHHQYIFRDIYENNTLQHYCKHSDDFGLTWGDEYMVEHFGSATDASGRLYSIRPIKPKLPQGYPVHFTSSLDYGKTWNPEVHIGYGSGGGDEDYRLVPDGQGRICALWPDWPYTAFNYSSDYALTWSGQSSVMEAGFDGAYASFSGNVYVTGGENYNIYIARSSDYGKTWSSSVMISDPAVRAKSPKIACDNSGHVYVIWQGYSDSNVYFNCSSDYGSTWLPVPIKINEGWLDSIIDTEPSSYDISCDNFGHIYVGWIPDEAFGQEAPFFRRSSDYGVTWQEKKYMRFYSRGDSYLYNWARPMRMVSDDFGRVAIMWKQGFIDVALNFSQNYGDSWLHRPLHITRNGNLSSDLNLSISDLGHLTAIWEIGSPVDGWSLYGSTLQFSNPTSVETNSYMTEK